MKIIIKQTLKWTLIALIVIFIASCGNKEDFIEMKENPNFNLNFDCSQSNDINKVLLNEVIINWNIINGADAYEILINGQSFTDQNGKRDFEGIDGKNGVILNIPDNLNYDTEYSITVRAKNKFQYYPSSSICRFMLENPYPIVDEIENCFDNETIINFVGNLQLEYELFIYSDASRKNVIFHATETDFEKNEAIRTIKVLLEEGSYYYEIKTILHEKIISSELTEFVTRKTTKKPYDLNIKEIICIDNKMIFEWSNEKYGYYEVEVDYGEGFTSENITFDYTDENNPDKAYAVWNFELDNLKNDFTWRVKHTNDVCKESEWISSTHKIVCEIPVIPTDINSDNFVCTENDLNINWKGADYGNYIVEIDKDQSSNEDWTSDGITVTGNSTASFTIPSTWTAGTYTWRIKHQCIRDESEWTTGTFDIDITYHVQADNVPVDGTSPYDAVVTWTSDNPTDNYLISISSDGGNTWSSDVNVTGTKTHTFTGLTGGTYVWRVKSNSTCNNDWQIGKTFCVSQDPNTLINPIDACSHELYSFNWSNGISSEEYEVVISKDNSTWTPNTTGTIINENSSEATITSSGDYWWKVRHKTTCGTYGNWIESSASFHVADIPTKTINRFFSNRRYL